MTLERAADSRNRGENGSENRTQGADSQKSDAMESRTMVAGGESNRCFFFLSTLKYHHA